MQGRVQPGEAGWQWEIECTSLQGRRHRPWVSSHPVCGMEEQRNGASIMKMGQGNWKLSK